MMLSQHIEILHTHPSKNSLGHIKTSIGLFQPIERFKKHLQSTGKREGETKATQSKTPR